LFVDQAKICRKEEKFKQAQKIFSILSREPPLSSSQNETSTLQRAASPSPTLTFTQPHITLQHIKQLWAEGQRQTAFETLKKFVTTLPTTTTTTTTTTSTPSILIDSPTNTPLPSTVTTPLLARCWFVISFFSLSLCVSG
jgi:hypothetical protein